MNIKKISIYFLLIFLFSTNIFSSCLNIVEKLSDEHRKNIAPRSKLDLTILRIKKFESRRPVGYYDKIMEVNIDALVPIHYIPNRHRFVLLESDGLEDEAYENSKDNLDTLKKEIFSNGYILDFAIEVGIMPNGELRVLGGHHRVQAMKELGEKTIPANIYIWNELDPASREIYRDAIFKTYSKLHPELFEDYLKNPQNY